MQQTIFFKNRALVVTDQEEELRKNATQYADAVIVREPATNQLRQIIVKMQPADQHMVIVTRHVGRVMDELKKLVTTIPAAGGLVYNQNRELLLIFRRGKWDLPKGKLDEGEALEDCALREVEEETGVGHLQLDKPLLLTYHTYLENGELVLKESHWYLMHCGNTPQLVPQTDEDIEKCEWVAARDLIPYLDNTHPSIVEVIRKGMQELQLALP
jgi:8-oxo-dGTP pyrophosphatase MutT (NUDIX family)